MKYAFKQTVGFPLPILRCGLPACHVSKPSGRILSRRKRVCDHACFSLFVLFPVVSPNNPKENEGAGRQRDVAREQAQ
jgi:hypothetical protein